MEKNARRSLESLGTVPHAATINISNTYRQPSKYKCSINFGTIASRWIPEIRLNTFMNVKGYNRNYTVSYDYFNANF